MKKSRIIVVGSANTDMVVNVNELPKPGETVLGGQFITAQGGKGANQAVAAARLGADVTFITRLGKDDFGKRAFSAYESEGIHTDYIVWDEIKPSGVAIIMVNQKGENIIAVASGSNGHLCSADVQAAEFAFQSADTLLVQLEIPMDAIQSALEIAKKYNLKTILNPAPAKTLPDNLLKSVDYLTPNESEFSILTGFPPDVVHSKMKNFTRQKSIKALILTMGSQGARIVTGEMNKIMPSYPVKAIDTVAAGDAFNGAFAVALSRGDKLEQAVRFANAVGALSVTRTGAQPSLPRLDEVYEFLGNK